MIKKPSTNKNILSAKDWGAEALRWGLKALRLGFAVAGMKGGDGLALVDGQQFMVNPDIEGDIIHDGGRTFQKGIIYNVLVESISHVRYKKMMALKMNGINFFMKLEASPKGSLRGLE